MQQFYLAPPFLLPGEETDCSRPVVGAYPRPSRLRLPKPPPPLTYPQRTFSTSRRGRHARPKVPTASIAAAWTAQWRAFCRPGLSLSLLRGDADSEASSRFVERMLSVVATSRQQNCDVLELLAVCCRTLPQQLSLTDRSLRPRRLRGRPIRVPRLPDWRCEWCGKTLLRTMYCLRGPSPPGPHPR